MNDKIDLQAKCTKINKHEFLSFDKHDKRIGTLFLENNKFVFEGNADKSAKIFFEYLIPYIDNYMKINNHD